MESRENRAHPDILSLVRRIKEGDSEAFMKVTEMYQKKVFILAYSFFRNKEDALDLVQ
jgi:RNA polymerase sigma-70 factor (ECF subfamily)